jgi:hypothetical protein
MEVLINVLVEMKLNALLPITHEWKLALNDRSVEWVHKTRSDSSVTEIKEKIVWRGGAEEDQSALK